MSKVALHLREHDLPAEVFDFQASRDGLANELVVRFDFFAWCFYQYFSMLVAEAHKRLCLAGHLTDRQPAIVQRLAHIQEDNGVYYAAENISVSVPHQFLNSNKCHVRMSCIVVLSSTTNLRNIPDNNKHFKPNFIKNQTFSNRTPAA